MSRDDVAFMVFIGVILVVITGLVLFGFYFLSGIHIG